VSLPSLGVGYIALGAVLALVIAGIKRRMSLGEALWIVGLWPLYAPLAFARADTGENRREAELLAALARAKDSPLAGVLPDAESVRILGGRLREAGARLADLDEVLARPDFDPAAAEQRASELLARGAMAAASTTQLRVRTLGQLHALRERYRSELDEVGELIAQLVTQAELVRELVARVEGLGELFAYQAAIEIGGSAEYAPGAGRSA